MLECFPLRTVTCSYSVHGPSNPLEKHGFRSSEMTPAAMSWSSKLFFVGT